MSGSVGLQLRMQIGNVYWGPGEVMRKEEVGEVNVFKEGPLRFSFPHPIKFGLVTLIARVF